jgi:hypothetical protein
VTRDEKDPESPVEIGVVLATSQRYALSWRLVVRGKEILTTAEHPFWVQGKGWTDANQLHMGDVLRTLGGSASVEVSEDTGEGATVYNLTIEPQHTYFVGGEDWNFAIWAHNATIACGGTGGAANSSTAQPSPFNGVQGQVSHGTVTPRAPLPFKGEPAVAASGAGLPKQLPKQPKTFLPLTNPPQLPPKTLPPGYNLRTEPPSGLYPNGYWKIEKQMPNGGRQPIDPSTFPKPKPGKGTHDTHVEFPPGYPGPW